MATESSDDLQALLTEVGRHLAWQQGSGSTELLAVAGPKSGPKGAAPRTVPAQPSAERGPRQAPAAAPVFDRLEQRSAQPLPPARPQVGPPSPVAKPPASRLPDVPVHRPWMKEPAVPAPVVAPPAAEEGAPRRTLDEIRRELGDCRRCKLCEGRKQIVFGVGNPRAQLVFVGEGPGAEEDAQGVPFVGPAGQLLTKMIEAMGFSRDEVYICNVVKCRPPNNRKPEPDEIAACRPFLEAQLASLRPKAIVALGAYAAHALLRETTAISHLRGSWKQYEGIPLMPTFHPAYLLRSPEEKKKAWSDLQQVMKLFGKAPAK